MPEKNEDQRLAEYVAMGDKSVDKMVAASEKIIVLEHEDNTYISASAVGAVCTAFIMAEAVGIPDADVKMLYTLIALVERSKGKRLSESMDVLMDEKTPEEARKEFNAKLDEAFDKIMEGFGKDV